AQTVVPQITYVVAVAGPCNETININNATNLNVGALFGTTITINGSVNVTGSNSVFLYGLNVTNPAGNAFTITSSHNVTLWTCTGNGNQGVGLSVGTLSDVTVDGPGSFDNNAGGGIGAGNNSVVYIATWGGAVDVSRNQGSGVGVGDGALFLTYGNTTINDNVSPPGAAAPSGVGVIQASASKVQIANCFGPNQISGNQGGGIDARETSELALWPCSAVGGNFITGNGPVGIRAGGGTQVALYDNVQISGHSRAGIELYGRSQLNVFGPNLISQNGSAGDPRSAGIVVDGNSEAYLRGGTISGNQGPGILALVNSSADFTGATFTGNSGGVITCDSSAVMVSDLPQPMSTPGKGVACRTPHNLGNDHGNVVRPTIPDFTAQKLKAAQYKAMARRKH
ncbi:MAG TPA: right-handed parallel beta-helix repeat-containing protein, partial [Terracidiphilus sp.]